MKNTTDIDNIEDVDEYDHDQMVFDSMLRRGATEEEAARAVDNLYWYGSVHSPDDIVHQDDNDDGAYQLYKRITAGNGKYPIA